jgi:hypothetical protein
MTTSELWNCHPMNFTTASPEFWMAKVAMATPRTKNKIQIKLIH